MSQTITTDENGCATAVIAGVTITYSHLKPHTTYDADWWVEGRRVHTSVPKGELYEASEKFHDAAAHLWDLIARELRLEQFVRWLTERLSK